MIRLDKVNHFITAVMLCQIVSAFTLSLIQSSFDVQFDTAFYLIAGQVLTIFVPVVIYCFATRADLRENFPFRALSPRNCLYIVALSILSVPSMQFLSLLTSLLFPNDVSSTVSVMFNENQSIFVPLLAFALTPAIFEELAMRGVAYTACKKLDLKTIALLNGLYFGLMHLNFQQLPYAFALGVVFALMRYYTRSIISTMLAHFTINAFSVFLSFAAMSGSTETAAVSVDFSSMLPVILIYALVILPPSILLFYFTFKSFRSYNRKRDVPPELDFELVISEENPAIVEVKPFSRLKLLSPSFFIMLGVYALLMAILTLAP